MRVLWRTCSLLPCMFFSILPIHFADAYRSICNIKNDVVYTTFVRFDISQCKCDISDMYLLSLCSVNRIQNWTRYFEKQTILQLRFSTSNEFEKENSAMRNSSSCIPRCVHVSTGQCEHYTGMQKKVKSLLSILIFLDSYTHSRYTFYWWKHKKR